MGLPSDLLRRRPDIRRAEAQLHAATARIGVATADLFPVFSLTGTFGFSSADLTKLSNLANSKFWSFGPSVTWPIFAGGSLWWDVKVQDALTEQALLTYQKTVLTALKEVETALVAYAKQQAARKSLSVAVANNRKAVDLAMTLYLAGKIGFLERHHRPAQPLCHRRRPGPRASAPWIPTSSPSTRPWAAAGNRPPCRRWSKKRWRRPSLSPKLAFIPLPAALTAAFFAAFWLPSPKNRVNWQFCLKKS